MLETDCSPVTVEAGVTGDFRGGPGRRQVTVLSREDWSDACRELDRELPWTTRRANLLVSGLRFTSDSVGQVLSVGDLRLEITGETDPCQRMSEACPGLREALTPNWRGGVCCRVLSGAEIRINDPVSLDQKGTDTASAGS